MKILICRTFYENGSCLFPRAAQDEISSTLMFLQTQFENGKININSEELFKEQETLDNMALIEYIVSKDDSWIRVREELIGLLKMIEDRNDKALSQDKLKRLMKNTLKTSPGLVDCLNSINSKYPWTTEKARFEQCKSFFINVIVGWGIWAFDVGSDIVFAESIKNIIYSGNLRVIDEESSMTVYNISIAHIVLPWCVSLLVFLIMILDYKEKCLILLGRFPIPIFTKFKRFFLEMKAYDLKTEDQNIGTSSVKEKLQMKLQKSKKDLEIQEAFVNLSLILEGTVESSFQLWFQVLYFFPVIVFSIRDSYDWFLGVRIISILSSFVSYSASIVNSRQELYLKLFAISILIIVI